MAERDNIKLNNLEKALQALEQAKKWKAEIQSLQSEYDYDSIGKEQSKTKRREEEI